VEAREKVVNPLSPAENFFKKPIDKSALMCYN